MTEAALPGPLCGVFVASAVQHTVAVVGGWAERFVTAVEIRPALDISGCGDIHGCSLLFQVITRTSPKRRVITITSKLLVNYFKITSEVLSVN